MIQARRIVELQRRIEGQVPAVVTVPATGNRVASILASGNQAPNIRAKDLKGRETVLALDKAKSRVLHAFSPSCIWCQRNAGNFKALVAQASNRFVFIRLALNGQHLQEFVSEHKLKIPVYEALDAPGFGYTPEMVVVSPRGTIEAVWPGAFLGGTKMQAEGFFKVRLPESAL